MIEGAHSGAGLGHNFLRHVERTRVLVHVLDMAGIEGRDPLADFRVICRELALYNETLAGRPQLIAANKMDLTGSEENLAGLRAELGDTHEIVPISAATGQGVDKLVGRLLALLQEIPESQVALEEDVPEVVHLVGPRFAIRREDGELVVTGREIEKHVAMTDLGNNEAVERLQRIMQLMGLEQALRDNGARNGDMVRIGDFTFDFVD